MNDEIEITGLENISKELVQYLDEKKLKLVVKLKSGKDCTKMEYFTEKVK
jgi:hypothetical protein